MATGLHSSLVIRDELISAGFIEGIGQNVNAFNEASRGAIILEQNFHQGDYTKRRFFDQIASTSISRRDLTSTSAATGVAVTMDEVIGVKLHRKAGPFDFTEGSLRTGNVDIDEFAFQLGLQIAKRSTQAMLNAALLGLATALANTAALLHDATDGSTAFSDVNTALSKFGDAREMISALVMHSATQSKLYGDGISNYKIDSVVGQQFNVGDRSAAFGRPIVVSDSSSLVNTDGITSGTDSYYGLGLVPRAAVVTISESLTSRQYYLDRDQVTRRIHPEFAFTLEVKGFKWDTSNGGANPTDATLGTGSNWDAVVADDQDKAGVIWEANEA